jgi:hypothetical protein
MSRTNKKIFGNIKVIWLKIMGRKRTALASFPRSGNTWLRFMIEEATGLPSGSIYPDRVLPRSSHGVVIKTHALDSFCYTHAVHLIRNPFDAVPSFFHWRREIAGEIVPWEEHISESIRDWRLHTEHWLAVKKPVLRIKYEDLLEDPERELREVLTWLGFDVFQDKIAGAVSKGRLENMRGVAPRFGEKFFRQGQAGLGVNQFSEQERRLVIANLKDLLTKLDYSIS